MRNIYLSVFFIFFLAIPSVFSADQKSKDSAKQIATQNIGGLLFDVDEGVKIEQGPGGSVYMKSNKEYMQEKFSKIEQEMLDLEARVKKLEEKDAKKNPSPASAPGGEAENRRVLIT